MKNKFAVETCPECHAKWTWHGLAEPTDKRCFICKGDMELQLAIKEASDLQF